MASMIFLGGLKPHQYAVGDSCELGWQYWLKDPILRGSGGKAMIAKGNLIEGIEAKK